jgi:hypothetical protein
MGRLRPAVPPGQLNNLQEALGKPQFIYVRGNQILSDKFAAT